MITEDKFKKYMLNWAFRNFPTVKSYIKRNNYIADDVNKIISYYILSKPTVNCLVINESKQKPKQYKSTINLIFKDKEFKQEGLIILPYGCKSKGWRHIVDKHVFSINNEFNFLSLFCLAFNKINFKYAIIFTFLLLLHTLKALDEGLTQNIYYSVEDRLIVELDLSKNKFKFLPLNLNENEKIILRLVIARIDDFNKKITNEIITFYPRYYGLNGIKKFSIHKF